VHPATLTRPSNDTRCVFCLLCADHPAELPSYIGRALTFSYFLEILRLPALADFTRALMKAFFGGDASEWERALLMPHYNAAGMPSCSLHQVCFRPNRVTD
jgi:hypothetical protein